MGTKPVFNLIVKFLLAAAGEHAVVVVYKNSRHAPSSHSSFFPHGLFFWQGGTLLSHFPPHFSLCLFVVVAPSLVSLGL